MTSCRLDGVHSGYRTNTRSEVGQMSSVSGGFARLFTVVIASLCDDARAELLKRACESVRAMAGALDYSIIVVANGPRVSTNVLEWLSHQSDVRVIRLRSGSHPLARRVGAEASDSEFLGFLDDDDEFIPGTLERKISYFRAHPEVDLLVTDGLRIDVSGSSNVFPPPQARSPDLIRTMLYQGWTACALTVRNHKVDLSAFDAELRHMEWTLTVLTLAKRHRVGFLDEPAYRYYETTPNSLSKSTEHALAAPEVWRRLSKEFAGTPYDAEVNRRYGMVCHNVSYECARQGRMGQAWRLHVESMLSLGGVAFIPYSIRLLLYPLRRLLA
jgi:glycosyltransferase involved in cell wall biosynthesis